ncbi:hypothetical protein GCM10027082_12800 [Comamonas humi]
MVDMDDEAPARPRWLGWLIAIVLLAVVLGLLNIGRLILRPDPVDAAVAARPELAAAKALVEASDCMRCHAAARQAVGPSFQEIAARHANRADAVEFLAGKIRNGSVGDWGRVVMPRHPQIGEDDARRMAEWVLAAPPAAR